MKRLLCRHRGLSTIRAISAACGFLLLAVGISHAANSPIAVPYADSFESYPAGSPLIGTNGWYSVNPTGATVIAGSYSYPLRTPLEVPSPSQIVQIVDDVTNVLVHTPGADTNIWVDTMLLPVRSTVQPDVSNDVQLAAYVNTNGRLVVFHKYYRTGASETLRWSELDHPPLPTNEWARLTVKIDYLTGAMYQIAPGNVIYTNKYFQLSLNGGEPLTNAYAYTTTSFDLVDGVTPYPTNGNWFLMPVSGSGGPTNISSVTIQGTGLLDDFVVTNSDVFASTPTRWSIEATAGPNGTIFPGGSLLIPEGDTVEFTAIPDDDYTVSDLVVDGSSESGSTWEFSTVTTSHTIHASFVQDSLSPRGVELSWYAQHGIDPDGAGPLDGEDGDMDGDGALNWEEYVADTVPTDQDSVFSVLDTDSGSFVVTFLAGATNGGATASFAILRTTDIMDTNTWSIVTNGLPRDATGTNVWTDTNPPAETPVFYRPAIPWP